MESRRNIRNRDRSNLQTCEKIFCKPVKTFMRDGATHYYCSLCNFTAYVVSGIHIIQTPLAIYRDLIKIPKPNYWTVLPPQFRIVLEEYLFWNLILNHWRLLDVL